MRRGGFFGVEREYCARSWRGGACFSSLGTSTSTCQVPTFGTVSDFGEGPIGFLSDLNPLPKIWRRTIRQRSRGSTSACPGRCGRPIACAGSFGMDAGPAWRTWAASFLGSCPIRATWVRPSLFTRHLRYVRQSWHGLANCQTILVEGEVSIDLATDFFFFFFLNRVRPVSFLLGKSSTVCERWKACCVNLPFRINIDPVFGNDSKFRNAQKTPYASRRSLGVFSSPHGAVPVLSAPLRPFRVHLQCVCAQGREAEFHFPS